MSWSDTGSSGSILYKSSSTENDYETDKDMGVVQLITKGSALDIPPPYHKEPILDGERAVQDTEEIDIDGIPIASLEERFYDRIRTEQWYVVSSMTDIYNTHYLYFVVNTCGIGTVCRVFYFFHFSLVNVGIRSILQGTGVANVKRPI